MAKSIIQEHWYFKKKTIFLLMIICSLFPFGGILLIPLVYFKINHLEHLIEDHGHTVAVTNDRPIVSTPVTQQCAIIPRSNITSFFDNLPNDVLNLLLFTDGPLANYTDKQGELLDPSAIHLDAPIGTPLSPAPDLGYFPSYSELNPDERSSYLQWLYNVDAPIDIGYVFIFYYGLERILLEYPDKWLQAIKMILRLRNTHKNNSFLAYSHDAITATCIVNNRYDIFEKYIQLEDAPLDIAKLAYLAGKGIGLTAKDIISLASAVDFKNHRYINNHPIQFEHTLHELIVRQQNQDTYPLSPNILYECPRIESCLFANYSLKERTLSLPSILTHPKVQKDLYELLLTTHETIKKIPMQQRL